MQKRLIFVGRLTITFGVILTESIVRCIYVQQTLVGLIGPSRHPIFVIFKIIQVLIAVIER